MVADFQRADGHQPPRHGRWRVAVAGTLARHAARVILAAVFYLAVTPIGLLRSSLGRSPIDRRRRTDASSYRTRRHVRDASHLLKRY